MPSDCVTGSAASTTTTPHGRKVTDLPCEIIDLIASHVRELRPLKNLRLSCHAWNASAEPFLFETVVVKPDDESIRRFGAVGDSAHLGQHVRAIQFETVPDIDYATDATTDRVLDPEKWRIPLGLLRNFPRLAFQFPRASEVAIKFSADNQGHDDEEGALQAYFARETLISVLFDTLFHRQGASLSSVGEQELRPITTLTGTNLLKFSPTATKDTIRPTLKGMTGLHVSTRVKRRGLAVQFDALGASQQNLLNGWLEPISATLTSLTIYMDTYWGAIPLMDLGNLRLPRLKQLRLGNYCFAYPRQIRWIMSMTSLELLSFDDCPIVALIDFDSYLHEPHINVAQGIWKPQIYDDREKLFYVNSMKWSSYLEQLGRALPNLVDFRCGHGDWDERDPTDPSVTLPIPDTFRSAFENRRKLGTAIHSTRYVVFAGRGVRSWRGAWLEVHMDHPEGNEMPKRAQARLMHKINDKTRIPELSHDDRVKDNEALQKLLKILEVRKTS